ncbi:Hint domain-containing protein [Yoonia sp. F2084L]|uniref:Hint domain-containing protein n=1 Tax=Yoonia sp. F2084L TaxID=2926419 RepID=UPI001FF51D74|nr:Hint domain-containing protein [Yoonia sp. F2084L]MCK0096116.1 Hint domain-containing protein [Yoonia sp. F2084L]
MVLQTIFVIDSENLVIETSPRPGIEGLPIRNNSDMPNGTTFTYSSGGGTSVTIDDTDGGGNADIFNDDDRLDHVVTDGGGVVANGTTVEAESRIELRALDSNGDPTGPLITITVFSQGGNFRNVWAFGSDTALEDGVTYIKVGGSNAGSTPYADFITCFEAATQIKTQSGQKAAEDIVVGDMVWTRDGGYQPVRWAGRSSVAAKGAFAPIEITAGAIGNDTPLVVSPQHRILLRSPRAELLFGASEVLIAAKHLCGLPGITQREGGMVTYVHFMFDTHQIVSANDVLCESFFLSDLSVAGVEADQRRELLALFPSLQAGIDAFGSTAATTLKAFEAGLFRADLIAAQQPKASAAQGPAG